MRMTDYTQFNSQFPGREVIDGALWDTLTYTTGVTTVLNFFNAVRATIDLSNMTQAGLLPAPDSFLVRAIRIFVKNRPESTATTAAGTVEVSSHDDLSLLLDNSAVVFTIGQKDYGIYPSATLPAGGGAFGKIVVNNILVAGAAVDFATNGVPHIYNTYTLGKPVLIKSQINFGVQMTWPAGFVTLIRSVNISVVLDGDHIRAIQ